MALDVGGPHDAAGPRTGGCGGRRTRTARGRTRTAAARSRTRRAETNFAAYLAVGLWHHFLATGDEAFLDRDVADACAARWTS